MFLTFFFSFYFILEGYSFDEAELDGLFDNALSNLPDSDLKTSLKKHYGEHLKKLKRWDNDSVILKTVNL